MTGGGCLAATRARLRNVLAGAVGLGLLGAGLLRRYRLVGGGLRAALRHGLALGGIALADLRVNRLEHAHGLGLLGGRAGLRQPLGVAPQGRELGVGHGRYLLEHFHDGGILDNAVRCRATATRMPSIWASLPRRTMAHPATCRRLTCDRRSRHTWILGSSQSRRLSPNRLKANTARLIAMPGNRIIHGASR